ncbi:hypothetical protein [Lawsonella sp.]|uniref:hypothetical protein n=1 Tax=Lawsonella sp. TaxID=2041415 RepID=UPI0025BC4C6D|nr:hypothetical protein [Lawsonella sp.]
MTGQPAQTAKAAFSRNSGCLFSLSTNFSIHGFPRHFALSIHRVSRLINSKSSLVVLCPNTR